MKLMIKIFVQVYFISMNIKINILVTEQQQRQMEMETQWSKTGGAAEAVLRGKFIAIQSSHKKLETSQINNLTF